MRCSRDICLWEKRIRDCKLLTVPDVQKGVCRMVEVQKVTKSFKKKVVLEDVSAHFGKGMIHGIIGRNGSGKTVLLKCICGFLSADRGEIFVDGRRVMHSTPQDIGIILETPGFIQNKSGYQNLKMLASIRGRVGKAEIRDVMEKVGLDADEKKAVRKYSLGMRQRLAIAQAIMESPKLLLLDEPMNGLDKRGVQDIREILLGLKEEGVTVIMASHYAEDIDMLCDTVWEMAQGRLNRAGLQQGNGTDML